MNQVYSTPEVKDFASEAEVTAFEQEMGITHDELFQKTDPMTGEPNGLKATFLPELSLNLQKTGDNLFESDKSKFFQVGKDIPVTSLKWKGIFKVIPRSILGTSEVILKQTKTEMANMLIPLFVQPAELVMKAAMQILKINEEDPADWLPESWLNPPPPQPAPAPDLFTPVGGTPSSVGADNGQNPAAHTANNQQTMQNRVGMSPQQAQTVVPQAQVSGGPSMTSMIGNK